MNPPKNIADGEPTFCCSEHYVFKKMHDPCCDPLKGYIEEKDPQTGEIVKKLPQSVFTHLRDLSPEERALVAPKGQDVSSIDVPDDVLLQRFEQNKQATHDLLDKKYNDLLAEHEQYKKQNEERYQQLLELINTLKK